MRERGTIVSWGGTGMGQIEADSGERLPFFYCTVVRCGASTTSEWVSALSFRVVHSSSPIEDVGKGLQVYARQPDGSWKLTHDIWTSDESVAPSRHERHERTHAH
jgi:hypothetical protein